MIAAVRELSPSQVILQLGGSPNENAYHAVLGEHFLVCVLDETTGSNAVAVWENSASSDVILRKLLVHFFQKTGARESDAELKIIATASVLDKMRSLSEKFAFKSFKEVSLKDCERREVFFMCQSARLRLSAPVLSLAEAKNLKKVAKTPKKVLVVDDSKTIRDLLTKILNSDPGLQVVACAERPSQVEQLIREHQPDVITLDIHMPEMDGVTLLKQYLSKHPVPTVMITSISMEESSQVLTALEAGAVDYIQKPSFQELARVAPLIIEKVKTAADVRLKTKAQLLTSKSSTARHSSQEYRDNMLVAIGSSTGGTEALKVVLTQLPDRIPPILIVQHIPAVFSKAFADRLNQLCPFRVKEAQDGDQVVSNQVLIAPGGLQMKLVRSGLSYQVKIEDSAPVNRHKPSVDVLFDSVAELIGKNAVGVILTGMGADGAKGLLKLRTAGARTIAQDQESCVVFGMPAEAIKLGAACEVHSLNVISGAILKFLKKQTAA